MTVHENEMIGQYGEKKWRKHKKMTLHENEMTRYENEMT